MLIKHLKNFFVWTHLNNTEFKFCDSSMDDCLCSWRWKMTYICLWLFKNQEISATCLEIIYKWPHNLVSHVYNQWLILIVWYYIFLISIYSNLSMFWIINKGKFTLHNYSIHLIIVLSSSNLQILHCNNLTGFRLFLLNII